MKKRILIWFLVAALLLGGGVVLAYNVIWSGTANITIEPPTATPTPTVTLEPLEVTQVYVGLGNNGQHDGTVSGGVWSFSTSDDPTGQGTLYVQVYNPRTTSAELQSFVNGLSTPLGPTEIAPGVGVRAYKSDVTIGAGASVLFIFTISIDTAIATPGTISGVSLEIKEI